MNLRPIIFIAAVFSIPVFVHAQVKLTLQQAIDSTMSRNLQIKQALFNSAVTEETLKQSKYNQLPSLTASPQATFNWGRSLDVSTYNYTTQRVFLISGSLGTQVTLFQGGQLRRQIVQNKLQLLADQTNIVKVKNDLILATATAFLQILTSEELLGAARQQIALAKHRVQQTQKGLDAGNKSLADLEQAKAQVAGSELDEATIQNQLEASRLTLKQLIEMPDTHITIVKPDISNVALLNFADTSTLYSQALNVNPDIKVANIQRDAAYQNIKVAKSALFPILSLFGSVGSNFSDARTLLTGTRQVGFDTIGLVNGTGQRVITPAYISTVKNYSFTRQFKDNFFEAAGITMQIPIFNRFNAQTNIRKAKLTYQNAQLSAQLAMSRLKKLLGQALLDWHTAQKRLDAAKSNFDANKQVLYISEKRYQVGLLNSLDYNTTVTNYNKAEFDLIQTRYDLIFKAKIIDYYLGKPLSLNSTY